MDTTIHEGDPATNYHDTIDDLRRELMKACSVWRSQCRRMDAEKISPTDMSDDQRIAYAASAMSASYSYTLAAVLGIAQKTMPGELATHLAFEADEILTNGDFEDHNADVRQPDEPAEGVGQ